MAEASCRTGAHARSLSLSLGALVLFLAGCGLPILPDDPSATSRVDIVVSDDLPAYEGVADSLFRRLSPAPRVHRLRRSAEALQGLVSALQAGGRGPVVAIGPEAMQAAARVSDRPMVFCQVYHYEIAAVAAFQGVKATPPAAKQFRAWKLLDPRLKRVALVTGPDSRELAAEARAAAKQAQLELAHVEVRSDKELLYAVKRLDASIQGIWVAPDRRVLSAEVLREALSHSVRQGKSVLVFSPQLLPYGALLSVEGEHEDVAERVLAQLRRLEDGSPPARVLALTRARVEVNPLVARHLGLAVPPAFQGGTRVF